MVEAVELGQEACLLEAGAVEAAALLRLDSVAAAV